jgi:hypothetical protein
MKKKYWGRYGNIREKWKREGRDGDIAKCGRQGHYTHNNDDDDDDERKTKKPTSFSFITSQNQK